MASIEAKPSMDESLPVTERPQMGEKRNVGANAGIHPSLYIMYAAVSTFSVTCCMLTRSIFPETGSSSQTQPFSSTNGSSTLPASVCTSLQTIPNVTSQLTNNRIPYVSSPPTGSHPRSAATNQANQS